MNTYLVYNLIETLWVAGRVQRILESGLGITEVTTMDTVVTNTAKSILLAMGMSPEDDNFNIAVDYIIATYDELSSENLFSNLKEKFIP